MTTIDHQQAAVRAMNRHRWATEEGKHYATMPLAQFEPLDSDRALLAAATPHLRAETVDRLKNFRNDYNDYQHTYAIPGDPYVDGYLTACNAIIALLEGGGE